MRSFLFVPADSEKKIPKALAAGADAVILDLEDAVSLERKPFARKLATEILNGARSTKIFVRVNALGTALTLADLEAVMPSKPDGLVLPKSGSAAAVNDLHRMIIAIALGDDSTPIVAIATETAASLFHMGTYGEAHPRLAGLTWGMEDLAAALGASSNRDDTGSPTAPYALARTLCLIAARAADVAPIDAVYANFRDADGLAKQCSDAARDGFTGKMCIHPDQVEPINEAFTPSAEAMARARRIVDAFAAAGNPGVLSLDGQMLDAPHLKAAEALLRR